MKKITIAAIIATAFLSVAPSYAGVIDFGSDPSYRDCTFTCTTRLQQQYAAARFGNDKININRISFFGTILPVDLSAWKLTLANMGGSAISTSFAGNLGANAGLFDTGATTLVSPNRVDFIGNFVYDPSKGDLIVDIAGPGYQGGVFATTNDINRVFNWGNAESGYIDYGYGLRTQFELGPVLPAQNDVPEPGSVALFGLALAGLAAARRRKA